MFFFCGGCTPNTSNNVFVKHIESKSIHVIKCKRLVSKVDWYVLLKVTVKAKDRNKLFNPDIFVCNIFVRTFRKPRQQSIIGHTVVKIYFYLNLIAMKHKLRIITFN